MPTAEGTQLKRKPARSPTADHEEATTSSAQPVSKKIDSEHARKHTEETLKSGLKKKIKKPSEEEKTAESPMMQKVKKSTVEHGSR